MDYRDVIIAVVVPPW